MPTSAEHVSGTVIEVVRDIVSDFAPQELLIVDSLAALGRVPKRRFKKFANRQDPLGFGLAEIIALATPVVWTVVDHLAKRAAENTVDAAWKKVLFWRKRRRSKEIAQAIVPAYDKEQLRHIREKTVKEAMRAKMPKDRAEALADILVARLSLGDQDAGSSDTEKGDGPDNGDAE